MSEFPGLAGIFAGVKDTTWKYREVWFPSGQIRDPEKPFRFIVDNKEIQIPWDQADALVREIKRTSQKTGEYSG